MSPNYILIAITGYFCLLLVISWYTSRKADNQSYFIGNKNSPWFVVAFGMIGDSLSGVTFISLPGTVQASQFGYMQLVLGYVLGYFLIAKVLLPIFYKDNLTSIYSYLGSRFGRYSQMTGSFYFLVSRLIGAALRLFLAAAVLQLFLFDYYHIPFYISVSIIIALMLVYTYRGGIKTLVWTDTFQSSLLLLGVVFSIIAIGQQLNIEPSQLVSKIRESNMDQVFFWDWREPNFFFKQFISGAFICVVMTGLDQNMMQKNLSIPKLADAQKNVYWFSIIVVFVNLLFVALGALLFIYADSQQIALPINAETGKVITDKVFPFLALNHLGASAALVFIIGLTAATFNSADSVLTTLTTSFCIDFLRIDDACEYTEKKKKNIRHLVHFGFAILLLITIIISGSMAKTNVLDTIFKVAAYTYGPLLGLFVFGLFTKKSLKDNWVPIICIVPPILSWLLAENSVQLLNGYKFGYELLIINGILTFSGLMLISKKQINLIINKQTI